MSLKFCESKREEGSYGRNDVYGFASDENNADIVAGNRLILQESLATCAARRCGHGCLEAVSADCCDCNHIEMCVGIVCAGIVACRAFGTRSGGKCGVFLICAGDDFSVVEQNGGADAEMAVRGV